MGLLGTREGGGGTYVEIYDASGVFVMMDRSGGMGNLDEWFQGDLRAIVANEVEAEWYTR